MYKKTQSVYNKKSIPKNAFFVTPTGFKPVTF